jgi:uncharacterized damage-inducible protein DinB
MGSTTIRIAYDRWPQYNRRLRDVIEAMSDEQLAIRPSPNGLPIWAAAGHTAAMRVYWLCEIVGEAGGDATPFLVDGSTVDWADDLDHPHAASELADALDSTFGVIDACLDRWTIDMLSDPIRRDYDGTIQIHTRGSILQRLFTHEAYHSGEFSQTLGIHGLPQIDLWRPD